MKDLFPNPSYEKEARIWGPFIRWCLEAHPNKISKILPCKIKKSLNLKFKPHYRCNFKMTIQSTMSKCTQVGHVRWIGRLLLSNVTQSDVLVPIFIRKLLECCVSSTWQQFHALFKKQLGSNIAKSFPSATVRTTIRQRPYDRRWIPKFPRALQSMVPDHIC